TEAFVNAMNARPPQPLPALALRSDPPYSLTPILNTAGPRQNFNVKELPKVVIPTEVAVLSGRSQIIQPSEKPAILIVKSNNATAANQNGNAPTTVAANDQAQAQPLLQPQPAAAGAAAVLAAQIPGAPAGV